VGVVIIKNLICIPTVPDLYSVTPSELERQWTRHLVPVHVIYSITVQEDLITTVQSYATIDHIDINIPIFHKGGSKPVQPGHPTREHPGCTGVVATRVQRDDREADIEEVTCTGNDSDTSGEEGRGTWNEAK